jgi:hypothetical protein
MSDTAPPPTPKRRWFRWSLRTLFVVVTILCGVMAWTIHNWQQVQERETSLRAFCARGASLGPIFEPGEPIIGKETGRSIPVMWRLLGAQEPGGDIWLSPETFTEQEKRRLQSLFPDVYVVWFDDKNGRLLEKETPTGTFTAMWRCPTCGFIWDGGNFRSRSEALAATEQTMQSHNSSLHPKAPKAEN